MTIVESLRELQEQKAVAQVREALEPSYTVVPKPTADYEERAICEDRDYSLGFRDGFEQKMNAAMAEGFALDRYVQGVYVLRRAKASKTPSGPSDGKWSILPHTTVRDVPSIAAHLRGWAIGGPRMVEVPVPLFLAIGDALKVGKTS